MNQTIKTIVLACFITFFHLPAQAVSEQEAASSDRRGDFSVAAEAYKQLVALNPSSAALRLKYADVLAKNREWNAAINEYETMLKLHPNNTEAVLGIATVRRWQGNIREAKRANEQARLLSPTHSDPVLGLAATYALDHDFDNAGKLYSQAVTTWPADTGVKHAAYIFQRQRNPRLYLFWENDLSFESRQAGVNIPFGGREEIGVEYQDETSIAPALGNARVYTRSDKKVFYTHYFGLNHMLDFSARNSEYQYNVTVSSYTGIDTYQEYRLRYTVPLTPEQVLSVRYTPRPTTLKLSQDRFTAHKIEGEFNSRWTPRISTLIGGGWLRDLESNATSTDQLTDRSLIKLGAQFEASNRLSLGAKFITNPDLDNTMNSTLIAEGSYTLTDTWSALGRLRSDDYKTGAGQTSYYAGARFVPNSHWWSEFGLKYVTRGATSGTFGLASVSYRF